MRVSRYENRYLLSCSEHEYEILALAVEKIADQARDNLQSSGLRRAWSRRTSRGRFLRVDRDRRKDLRA